MLHPESPGMWCCAKDCKKPSRWWRELQDYYSLWSSAKPDRKWSQAGWPSLARQMLQCWLIPRYGCSSYSCQLHTYQLPGNEDDYIIISLVRSKELGFLKDLRRTNVMLTRCKRGMFICTSWSFLVDGKGSNSLVGRMAAECGDDAWLGMADVDAGNFWGS